jgi:glycosyltransferase involved in cell wall biosynthesis
LAGYRVNLAPLRFGAGLKGKITDGWFAGTPVVTTPIGAEGMAGDLPFGGAVCDSAVNFAAAAIDLHENLEKWITAVNYGAQILKERFSEPQELKGS